jgi:hypothetical protein
MTANTDMIGPLSPTRRLRRLDGRTREARFLRETEGQLIQHLGGPERVSPPQRFLVERVAADLLRLEIFDEKIAAGSMTEHDGRVAHALRNSVRLVLRELGLKPTAPKPPGLADIIADIGRQKRERLQRSAP